MDIRRPIITLVLVVMLVVTACSQGSQGMVRPLSTPPPSGWPTTWIGLSTDPNEAGGKDHRDVTDTNGDSYAVYYAADSQYLYLRMETVSAPGWNSTKPYDEARYKWWFDIGNTTVHVHGTTVEDAEFLLILEDLTDNSSDPDLARDLLGELTLMDDLNNDGFQSRWDSAHPPNYTTNNAQTAPTGNSSWWRRVLGTGAPGIGGPQGVMGADIGSRIDNTITGGNFVDIYVSWAALGNPSSLCLIWATDNIDPNLDQAQDLDRPEQTTCLLICVPPVAAFNATPTSGCPPLTVNFADQSAGNITSWNWTFGDGGTSTLQNPSHQYTSAGSYSVTLNVTTACGSDTGTKTNYITVGPGSIGDLVWADLDRDGTKDNGEHGVANITVCLISGSDNRAIIATTETDDNGYYLFPNLEAGAYIVDVNHNDDDMLDDYFSTTYNDPMNTSLAACEHFLGADFGYAPPELGIIGDYVWDDANRDGVRDDGETGIPWVTVILRNESGQTVLNVTETDSWGIYHFYDVEAGSYNVTIDLDDPDLGDYVPTTNTWVEALIASNDLDADFGLALCEAATAAFNAMPTSGCAPLTVNFTDLSTGNITSWNWTFGDGGTSTDQNPSHQYADTGSYNVTLTVSNACGSNATTKTDYITIYAEPIVDAGSDQEVCEDGDPIILSGATPPGGTWSGTQISGNTFNPSGLAPGGYTVTYSYTDTGTGCSDSDTKTVTVTECCCICGFVYRAGTTDPLVGWEVVLEKETNSWDEVERATTDDDGMYCFCGLVAGNYRVYEVLQPDWTQVSPLPNEQFVTLLGDCCDPAIELFGNFDFYNEQADPFTVGWEVSPIDRLAVLSPWIVLFVVVVAGVSLLILGRRGRGAEYTRR